MRCEDVQKQLRAYSAGELPVDVRQNVQIHLAECAKCRADIAHVDALAGVLAGAKTPTIPAGFASRVIAVARQRHESRPSVVWVPPRRWRLTSAPMRAAAAVAAFAVGAWGAMELSPPDPAGANAGDSQAGADPVVSDWFEAAPGDSLASRFLDTIGTEED